LCPRGWVWHLPAAQEWSIAVLPGRVRSVLPRTMVQERCKQASKQASSGNACEDARDRTSGKKAGWSRGAARQRAGWAGCCAGEGGWGGGRLRLMRATKSKESKGQRAPRERPAVPHGRGSAIGAAFRCDKTGGRRGVCRAGHCARRRAKLLLSKRKGSKNKQRRPAARTPGQAAVRHEKAVKRSLWL
jgi:hypothetical protein